MSHATHKQANDALCDPGVPIKDAIKLFERAYRRSNPTTKGFVLYWCGLMRENQMEVPDG